MTRRSCWLAMLAILPIGVSPGAVVTIPHPPTRRRRPRSRTRLLSTARSRAEPWRSWMSPMGRSATATCPTGHGSRSGSTSARRPASPRSLDAEGGRLERTGALAPAAPTERKRNPVPVQAFRRALARPSGIRLMGRCLANGHEDHGQPRAQSNRVIVGCPRQYRWRTGSNDDLGVRWRVPGHDDEWCGLLGD